MVSSQIDWDGRLSVQLLVEQVLAEAWSSTLGLGDEVAQFLDGLHLFVEELALDKVAEVGVIVATGQTMQVQKWLVDPLF